MATLKEVIDLARLDLNDDDKTRYPDNNLVKFVNNYIQEAVKSRPDLFLGGFLALPAPTLTLTSTFPMPNGYIRSCADYVIGRAMMLNTEESSMTKAANYIQLAAKEGGAP
jgi:hypothetical protein